MQKGNKTPGFRAVYDYSCFVNDTDLTCFSFIFSQAPAVRSRTRSSINSLPPVVHPVQRYELNFPKPTLTSLMNLGHVSAMCQTMGKGSSSVANAEHNICDVEASA